MERSAVWFSPSQSVNKSWVPHIPDFLWSSVSSANSMRLSFKERRTRRSVRCHVQEIRGMSLVFREMWDTTTAFSKLSKGHLLH